MTNIYEVGLDKNPANYQPLTPLTFLRRTAEVFPDKLAIIHGEQRINYAEYYANTKRLASAITNLGIKQGDTVCILAPNIPAFLDASFGVPMAGAVLNSLNIRLDAQGLAFILEHSECKVLLLDTAFIGVANEALEIASVEPIVIDISDPLSGSDERLGKIEYKDFLKTGDPDFDWMHPLDEWQAITLNYTSGTTGNPKGVVYSHRGAYLNALGNNLVWPLDNRSIYLWTLPMFHCNGWCFPWTIAAVGATHVCLRRVETDAIILAMAKHQVSHFCAAPIILNMLLNASEKLIQQLPHNLKTMTAGAPPPASVIEKLESLGIDVTQSYGLTEVYGPCVISEWKPDWDDLDVQERAKLKARQGVRYPTQENVTVIDPDTMCEVPADGKTMGEIMFRGNTTMMGYLKNPDTSASAFKEGWFHSGDLAVKHSDNFIEIRDRSKDIIISGGENISSVEIEGVLYSHPKIFEAAVVAIGDEKWGETPCAFVTLQENVELTEQDVIAFCKTKLASFKCPTKVVFGDLPKTSTGKVQKFKLRAMV